MKWVAIALAALAAAVVFAGLWIGGSLREQACISKAEAEFPVAFSEKGSGIYEEQPGFQVQGSLKGRQSQLAKC